MESQAIGLWVGPQNFWKRPQNQSEITQLSLNSCDTTIPVRPSCLTSWYCTMQGTNLGKNTAYCTATSSTMKSKEGYNMLCLHSAQREYCSKWKINGLPPLHPRLPLNIPAQIRERRRSLTTLVATDKDGHWLGEEWLIFLTGVATSKVLCRSKSTSGPCSRKQL